MYRHATYADIPFVLDLLEEFYTKAGGIYDIPFDRLSTLKTVRKTIDEGIVLVGRHSCAGATVAPFLYNHDYVVGSVLFWYFHREITILEALRDECKKRGANRFAAASLFPDNLIARYYHRLGLKPVEIASICPI